MGRKPVIALILAGGTGTRLWPLSRKKIPKQLLSLIGDFTLLQETSRRLLPLIPPENQLIITGTDYLHLVQSQMSDLYTDKAGIGMEVLVEPEGKNTAPAIFWAACRIKEKYGQDALILVLPSDHFVIGEEEEYLATLKKGLSQAAEGSLVTFGIKPSHPETGYGYIRIDNQESSSPYKVAAYVEKPNLEKAEAYIKAGNFYWNCGMFAFHVGTFLAEGKKYCPNICLPFLKGNPFDEGSVAEAYRQADSLSIDYAIMEKTNKAYMVPVSFGWNDVGSWYNLFMVSPKNSDGNVVKGPHLITDSHNCLIFGKERLIAAFGIQDLAVVDTPDALLICPLDQTQRVKEVVSKLQQSNSKAHLEPLTVQRPWGFYTVLREGPGYKVKVLVVKPKQKLSFQLHHHRSEHWIVVRGTAKLVYKNKEIYLREKESKYIPQCTLHRLENPGMIPLEIIETQYGSYLEEDDILRFEEPIDKNPDEVVE